MGVTYKTFGITIDRLDFGETSQVVHYLTEDQGRLAVLAKGSHRAKNQFGGTIDLLVYAQITASRQPRSSGLDLLYRVEVLTHFPEIRKDWNRYAAASYVIRLVKEGVQEKECVTDLFRLVKAALIALNDRPQDELLSIVLAFEWRLLKILGFSPELDRCVQCTRAIDETLLKRNRVAFSLARGGVLCDACSNNDERFTFETWRSLKILSRSRAEEISKDRRVISVISDLRFLLDRYWTFHLERSLDGAAWLRELVQDGVVCSS